jgi:ribonuclease P protein component
MASAIACRIAPAGPSSRIGAVRAVSGSRPEFGRHVVERLGSRAQFAFLRAHGTTVREGQLRIVAVRPPEVAGTAASGAGSSAVAYAISRRVGTAVRRNRARRRLREIFRAAHAAGSLPCGWYLVTVFPSATEPAFEELEHWVDRAIGRLAERLGC